VLVPDGKVEASSEDLREQGLMSTIPDQASAVTRELVEDVQESWAAVTRQIGDMLQATASPNGYEVKTVTVKLGVDGKGSIGVITAGLTAGFEITFERSQNESLGKPA